MIKTTTKWVRSVMLLVITMTIFSCAHGTAGKKETTVAPADLEETRKQYLEGLMESKKYVVAKVNGADITLFNLINRMNLIAPSLLRSHERGPEIDTVLKRDALVILIFRELAIQEAVKRGIKAPPEKIDEAIEKIRAGFGTDEAYKKFLADTGETEEALRKETGRDLLFDMIAEQEIYSRAKTGKSKEMSIELRRSEWEKELRNDAKIEITLDEVEKKLKEEAQKKEKK